jgi:4-hydroxybenzoate polyprenyltransferase
MFFEYAKLLRINQWIKQSIILIPIIILGSNLSLDIIFRQLMLAVAFSLIASSVYVMNDYFDFEEDKLDERYSNRPFVKGTIKIRTGLLLTIPICVVDAILLYWLNISVTIFYFLMVYVSINIVYSKLNLKKIELLGISIVAIGFSIRFEIGALFANLDFSWWAFVLFFEFAIIILSGKRFQKIVSRSKSYEQDAESIFENLTVRQIFWFSTSIASSSFFLITFVAFLLDPNTIATWGSGFIVVSILPISILLLKIIEEILLPKSKIYISEYFYRDKIVISCSIIVLSVMFLSRLNLSR